jgi:hypothetical protein
VLHAAPSQRTQKVRAIEGPKVNVHAAFLKITSAQLPFWGTHFIGFLRISRHAGAFRRKTLALRDQNLEDCAHFNTSHVVANPSAASAHGHWRPNMSVTRGRS